MATKLTLIRNDLRDIGMSHGPQADGAPKTYNQALNWLRLNAMGRFTSCDAELRMVNPRKGKMPIDVISIDNDADTVIAFTFTIAKNFAIKMPVYVSQTKFIMGLVVIHANEVTLGSGAPSQMRDFDFVFGEANETNFQIDANFTTSEQTELTPASLHDLKIIHEAFVTAGIVFPPTEDLVKMLVE